VRDLTTRLAALRTACGDEDPAELERAAQEARDRHQHLSILAEGEAEARRALSAAEATTAGDDALAGRLGRRTAELDRALAGAGEEAARWTEELWTALGGDPGADPGSDPGSDPRGVLEDRLADHDRAVASLRAAVAAVTERDAADQALASTHRAFLARVRE